MPVISFYPVFPSEHKPPAPRLVFKRAFPYPETMDITEKLEVLSRDAQYDLSCACGTRRNEGHRRRSKDGSAWLYPVTTASGGSGIMLKTLLSNVCVNDCKYCPLRSQRDPRRLSISPEEMASFFIDIKRKQELFGIFLSSGVTGTADRAMDRLIATAAVLRKKYRYRGYIHLKILPGASRGAIDEAMRYASAVSLNIETPGENRFRKLSSAKDYQKDIIDPMVYISRQSAKGAPRSGVHITSQFIVGASDETDREIAKWTEALYKRLNYQRLYFSAYQGGLGAPELPGEEMFRQLRLRGAGPQNGAQPPRDTGKRGGALQPELFGDGPGGVSPLLVREHRLYQMDFLFRLYGFSFDEILFDPGGNLDLTTDPKEKWAQAHPEFFPLSIRRAGQKELMRVPGIGLEYSRRITAARRDSVLHSLEDLRLPPAVLKKAGKYLIA